MRVLIFTLGAALTANEALLVSLAEASIYSPFGL
jgi:hypothetical protein